MSAAFGGAESKDVILTHLDSEKSAEVATLKMVWAKWKEPNIGTLTPEGKRITFATKKSYFAKFIRKLGRLDDETITSIAETDEDFVKICLSRQLKPYWTKKLEQINFIDNPEYHILPQLGIEPFDLLRSIVFAFAYIKHKSCLSKSRKYYYLQRASKLGCFQGSVLRIKEMIFTLQETRNNRTVAVAQLVAEVNAIAKVHKTPGYFLAALLFNQLACNFKKMDLELERTGKDTIWKPYAKCCFSLAFKNFYKARRLESISSRSLHNGFFGKGLFVGFNEHFTPEGDDPVLPRNWNEVALLFAPESKLQRAEKFLAMFEAETEVQDEVAQAAKDLTTEIVTSMRF